MRLELAFRDHHRLESSAPFLTTSYRKINLSLTLALSATRFYSNLNPHIWFLINLYRWQDSLQKKSYPFFQKWKKSIHRSGTSDQLINLKDYSRSSATLILPPPQTDKQKFARTTFQCSKTFRWKRAQHWKPARLQIVVRENNDPFKTLVSQAVRYLVTPFYGSNPDDSVSSFKGRLN